MVRQHVVFQSIANGASPLTAARTDAGSGQLEEDDIPNVGDTHDDCRVLSVGAGLAADGSDVVIVTLERVE